MSSESLTLTLTKRKGAEDRIMLETKCTRDTDEFSDGIGFSDRTFDVEEDRRRIGNDPVFQDLMFEIREKVITLICMQLY